MKKEELIEAIHVLHDNENCVGISIDEKGVRKYRYDDMTYTYRFDDDFSRYAIIDPNNADEHRTQNERIEETLKEKSQHTKNIFRAQAALIQQYFESEYPLVIAENLKNMHATPGEAWTKKQIRLIELYKEFNDVKEKLQHLFEEESWVVPLFIYWEKGEDEIYHFNAVYEQDDNTLQIFVISPDFKDKITNILTDFQYLMRSQRKQINVKRK